MKEYKMTDANNMTSVVGQVEPTVMQHTPGPWKFALFEHEPNKAFVQWRSGFAEVHGSRAGREANARLIAAAPELLECLRYMVCHIGDPMALETRDGFNASAALVRRLDGAA